MGTTGRPALFNTPEELIEKIDDYFEYVKGDFNLVYDDDGNEEKVYERYPEPVTITGLCLFLGFESRQSFYDYAERDGFSYAIKRARMRVEFSYESNLHNSQKPTSGMIFALKNMGWSDKTEIEQSGGINISWNEQKTYESK